MGKEELKLDLDHSKRYSISDVLSEIARLENKELATLPIETRGIPLRAIRLVLNGNIIHSLKDLETEVQDGDRIAIFPLLAGG